MMQSMYKNLIPSNVRDVFFTFKTILLDRNPIGLFHLSLYVFSIFSISFDVFLYLILRLIFKISSPTQPILFITGYSRSGTTPIYQILTKHLDVDYINNLIIPFPRSYPLVNWFYRLFNKRKTTSPNSYFGRTMGLYGTNDGAQLSYRWFNDEVFSGISEIRDKKKQHIRNFFSYSYRFQKKPIILKNCNFYLVAEQLLTLLPNSYFVFVKRDPELIIDSTISAREFIQGSREETWEFSLNSCTDNCNPVEEICLNIKHYHEIIESMKAGRFSKRVFELNYEDFCANPSKYIEEYSKLIFDSPAKAQTQTHPIDSLSIDSRMQTNEKDQAIIKNIVNTHLK